jgi:hypothetical protein
VDEIDPGAPQPVFEPGHALFAESPDFPAKCARACIDESLSSRLRIAQRH